MSSRCTLASVGLALLATSVAAPALAERTPDPGPSTPPVAMRAEEYAVRRARLAARMQDGVLLVLGAEEPAEDYLPYAQSLPFRYLTGITEPGAALLVVKRHGRTEMRLFVQPRSPLRELWDGERMGVAGAARASGLPAAAFDRLAPALDSLLQGGGVLYTPEPLPEDAPFQVRTPQQQAVSALARRHPDVIVASLDEDLLRLRAVKSAAEVDRLRRAALITALAQRAAIRSVRPGRYEFEVQALIEYYFRRNGAERPSFASIVGSGARSTTLHYAADDQLIEPGRTVVMDVGASYDGYAADVTRTVPSSGRFTPEQRQIYGIVLAAQKAAEGRIRAGVRWSDLNEVADSVLAAGLARLGLIDSPTATFPCADHGGPAGGTCLQLRLYYPHALGHGIGLEVHDPDASYYGALVPGSVVTLEPGLYLRGDALDVLSATPAGRAVAARLAPALRRYRDIGVRIEDDYVVGAAGAERLSADAPREPDEIEALMDTHADDAGRRPDVVDWYPALHTR